MKLGQHQEAFSRDLVRLALKAFELGYEIRWGEVQRMPEMQAIYIQTGRSKTMFSDHLKKCAADLHFFKNGELSYPAELGAYWESLSSYNRWGGNFDRNWTKEDNFKDAPHFERHIPQ
jgi:peptidoglycan L-alanyl-D-glutamate endopeptidase CwlK